MGFSAILNIQLRLELTIAERPVGFLCIDGGSRPSRGHLNQEKNCDSQG